MILQIPLDSSGDDAEITGMYRAVSTLIDISILPPGDK